MLYVELQRTHDGKSETRRFGPFNEITYGGFSEPDLLCDGQRPFTHVRQLMGIVAGGAPKSGKDDPDLWDQAVIRSA